MAKFTIDDPLGLDDMLAKECVICNEKDHQEDIVETREGWCHHQCLYNQALDEAEESEKTVDDVPVEVADWLRKQAKRSEENNHKLEI